MACARRGTTLVGRASTQTKSRQQISACPAVQELAAACDADPSCQAVEFSPAGRDGVNASLGSLKGTPGDRGAPLDLRRVTWNPRAVLLVREGVPLIPPDAPPNGTAPAQPAGSGVSADSGGGGLSGAAIAGIAVGAAAAAVVAAAAAAFVLLQRRRRRHRAELSAGSLQPPLLPTTTASGGTLRVSITDSSEESAVASSLKAGNSAGPSSQHSQQSAIAASPLAGVPPHILGSSGRGTPPVTNSTQQLPALPANSSGSRLDPDNDAYSARASTAAGSDPGLAPWAVALLSESAAGWEEAVVQESEITFLRGQDRQHICLGESAFGWEGRSLGWGLGNQGEDARRGLSKMQPFWRMSHLPFADACRSSLSIRATKCGPFPAGSGAFGSVWKVMLGGHTLAAAKVVEWGERARSQVEFIQAGADRLLDCMLCLPGCGGVGNAQHNKGDDPALFAGDGT